MELIKTELTPKERIRLYEAGEEVDRIPTGHWTSARRFLFCMG
jgi:hypothetical protein